MYGMYNEERIMPDLTHPPKSIFTTIVKYEFPNVVKTENVRYVNCLRGSFDEVNKLTNKDVIYICRPLLIKTKQHMSNVHDTSISMNHTYVIQIKSKQVGKNL